MPKKFLSLVFLIPLNIPSAALAGGKRVAEPTLFKKLAFAAPGTEFIWFFLTDLDHR